MTNVGDADSRKEAVEKLREMMKDIKFCMLTTEDEQGNLRSRPMALQESEFDGDLWFFTGKSTDKADQIRHHQSVNVSFSNPKNNQYISLSGAAVLVDDREKAEDLWNPFYRAWFPKGLEDPDLTLVKVFVDTAEYWDSPSSKVVQLWNLVRAVATGDPSKTGDHEKLHL